jgi:hypothetical protein
MDERLQDRRDRGDTPAVRASVRRLGRLAPVRRLGRLWPRRQRITRHATALTTSRRPSPGGASSARPAGPTRIRL